MKQDKAIRANAAALQTTPEQEKGTTAKPQGGTATNPSTVKSVCPASGSDTLAPDDKGYMTQLSAPHAQQERRRAEEDEEDLHSAIYSELRGCTQERNHVADRIRAAISPWLRDRRQPPEAARDGSDTLAADNKGYMTKLAGANDLPQGPTLSGILKARFRFAGIVDTTTDGPEDAEARAQGAGRMRLPKAMVTRFLRAFQPAGPDECWNWRKEINHDGYGRLAVCWAPVIKRVMAHRFSYEYHVGPIPDGLVVLHRCDNRRCVNPAHLLVGTMGDNNRDMLTKGRANISGLRPQSREVLIRYYKKSKRSSNGKFTSSKVAHE